MVQPDPSPPEDSTSLRKPDRSALTVRHMAVAVGVLVAIVLVLSLFSGGVGFAPAGPSVDPAAVPVVDAAAELTGLAAGTPFPLRVPAVPSTWRANSVGVDPVGHNPDGTGARAVRVGYLTPAGSYVQLQQSAAAEDTLVRAAAGTRMLPAQGALTVDGQKWIVYGTRPGEPVWVADTGAVRWVVTGSGTDDEFEALAMGVRSGRLLAG